MAFDLGLICPVDTTPACDSDPTVTATMVQGKRATIAVCCSTTLRSDCSEPDLHVRI